MSTCVTPTVCFGFRFWKRFFVLILRSSSFRMATPCQQILAVDARYSVHRMPHDPQFRTLYIRRRSQLLRQVFKFDQPNVSPSLDSSASSDVVENRKSYLRLRMALLAKKYGTQMDNRSLFGSSGKSSRCRSMSRTTIDSFVKEDTSDDENTLQMGRLESYSETSTNLPRLISTKSTESYAFSGVQHIFDQHKKAVGSVRFANDDPHRLACCSSDGFLSVITLLQNHGEGEAPYSILLLKGHTDENIGCIICEQKELHFGQIGPYIEELPTLVRFWVYCYGGVHGVVWGFEYAKHMPQLQNPFSGQVMDFSWGNSGDLIVSSSLDHSVRLWDTHSGNCLRTVYDHFRCGILTCTFHPKNNNFVVTGNERGFLQVLNVSTGKFLSESLVKTNGRVLSMCFDAVSNILWIGNDSATIFSFLFDVLSSKFILVKAVPLSSKSLAVTSISSLSYAVDKRGSIGGDGQKIPLLLVNCSGNALLLFQSKEAELRRQQLILRRRFLIRQRKFRIRSSFCNLTAGRRITQGGLGIMVVSGSEDGRILFYDSDKPTSKACVNELQGHSAPVLDVCFNGDESLLASCDANGIVIIWKRVMS